MAKKSLKKPAKAKGGAKAKTTKKVVAKKKVVTKKASKPAAKKVVAKKKVATKKVVAKKVVAKKVVAKKEVAKVSKPVAKPVAKKGPAPTIAVAKPVITPIQSKPQTKVSKPSPASRKQDDSSIDMDDDAADRDFHSRNAQAINYEPPKAFITRPDLKQPKPFIGNDKRTRYSDKELAEFKQIILGKLDEAQRDYDLLKSTLSHKDDHGTDDTSPTFKLLEDGSDVMSKEETAALAARQEKYIQSLQNAMVRIENKSYGICRVTGKLIPKERLRSVPHATLSIDAKLEQYR